MSQRVLLLMLRNTPNTPPRRWCSSCSIETQGERSLWNLRKHPGHRYQQTTCLSKLRTSQRLRWRHPWWPYTLCSPCKISTLKVSLSVDVSAYIINIIADENKENLGRFYCNRETLDGMFQSLPEVEGYNLETKSNNMSRKLIVQTLLLVKQISFQIYMEDKKMKSMKINK